LAASLEAAINKQKNWQVRVAMQENVQNDGDKIQTDHGDRFTLQRDGVWLKDQIQNVIKNQPGENYPHEKWP
jgi:hypothetical protein